MVYWMCGAVFMCTWPSVIILWASRAFTSRDQQCIFLITLLLVVHVCIYLVWLLLHVCVFTLYVLHKLVFCVSVAAHCFILNSLTSASQRCIPVVTVSVKRKQSSKTCCSPSSPVLKLWHFSWTSGVCVGAVLAQLFQENKQLGRYSGAVGKREKLPLCCVLLCNMKKVKGLENSVICWFTRSCRFSFLIGYRLKVSVLKTKGTEGPFYTVYRVYLPGYLPIQPKVTWVLFQASKRWLHVALSRNRSKIHTFRLVVIELHLQDSSVLLLPAS